MVRPLEKIASFLFIIVAIIFLIYSVSSTNIGGLFKKKYTLYANFNAINNIDLGSNVYIRGIKIGTVNDISLNQDYTVTVKLNIYEEINITKDSTIKIASNIVTGGSFIEIIPGIKKEHLHNNNYFSHVEEWTSIEDKIGTLFTKVTLK